MAITTRNQNMRTTVSNDDTNQETLGRLIDQQLFGHGLPRQTRILLQHIRPTTDF